MTREEIDWYVILNLEENVIEDVISCDRYYGII